MEGSIAALRLADLDANGREARFSSTVIDSLLEAAVQRYNYPRLRGDMIGEKLRAGFETTAGALRVIEAVGRPNFGIIYKSVNWWMVGQDYGPETIARLGAHVFNAYTQNHRFNPESDVYLDTWTKGRVFLDHIGIWEEGGVDSEAMFEGLHAIGYDGYVTVHQSFAGVMSIEESARKSAAFFKSLMAAR